MRGRARQHINVIICIKDIFHWQHINVIICIKDIFHWHHDGNSKTSGREPLGFNVASTDKPWKLHKRTGQLFYHGITIGLTSFFNFLSLIMPSSSESSVDELELDLPPLLESESSSLAEPLPDGLLTEPCLAPFCL